MARIGRIGIGVSALIGILPCGCATLVPLDPHSWAMPASQTSHSATTTVSAISMNPHGETIPIVGGGQAQGIDSPRNDEPFHGMAELSADALVQQVLARNPSLTQMTAAWQAASAR